MISINFSRYNIDGIGTIDLPDGRSGTVWVSLWVDPSPLTDESMIAGHEDLIAAAVKSGSAELHLADGIDLNILVLALNSRYALIKLINPDLACPVAQDIVALNDGTAPMQLRQSLSIAGTTFNLTGTAMLTVEGMSGAVSVSAEAVDGLPPSLLELGGGRELMDAAYHAECVRLDMIGLAISTHVAGQVKETGSILVEAHPLYVALETYLEARHCN